MDSVLIAGYVNAADPISTASDFEYNSHDSGSDYFDIVTPTNDDGAIIPSTVFWSFVDMGHVIAYSFPVEIEYDVSYDDRHMLDDGISGDETDNSDLSSNYEEFAEPDIILKVVEVPRKE